MRNVRAGAVPVLILVTAAMLSLAVSSVRLDSATSDEPAHIAAGMIKLQHGWLSFFREQPPLMNSISAAPVALAGYRLDQWAPDGNHWAVGRNFLYRSGNDPYRVLFLARLPTIVLFAALSLAVYAFVARKGRHRGMALVALVLTGFCPTLMAHGRLATVDMALAAFSFFAAIAFVATVERPTVWKGAVTGVLAAAALLSKVSGLILGPYFVLVLVVALLLRAAGEWKRLAASLAAAVVSGVAFAEALVWWLASPGYLEAAWPRLAATWWGRLAVPFAEYGANVATIREWTAAGFDKPQFMFGEFSASGWPSYYLVALLLKTTLPAILLVIAAGVLTARRARRMGLAAPAMLLFVVLFMTFAATAKLALGVRYVLPVYPFLYALVGLALATALRETKWPRGLAAAVALLAAWHVAENARAHPSYIAYFNQLVGSHRNADRFLIDSNLDWGQDLRRLELWCRRNALKEIAVHYFGGGDPLVEIVSAKPDVVLAPPARLRRGWFALSRHYYRISFDGETFARVDPRGRVRSFDYDAYLAAHRAEFVTSIGGSIDVYRVP